jgi:hypothetical protein
MHAHRLGVGRRIVVVVVGLALAGHLTAARTWAQATTTPGAATTAHPPRLSITEAALAKVRTAAPTTPSRVTPNVETEGGASLLPLHAATVALQLLDAHSTMTAMKYGGVEANPLMKDVASNRTALFGVKAAVATTTILATHHVGKRNRLAAVLTGIAINAAYAAIVAHNYRIANQLKK